NLLIFQVSRGDLNLLEVSEAEVAALKEQSLLANADAFTRILEVLADAELRLRDAASKKILIEVTLLKAIEARDALPIDAVLKQLNQLRNGGGSGASPALVSAATTAATPAGRPAAKTPAVHQETVPPAASLEKASVSADLAGLWTNLVEAVGRVSPFTRSYLVDASPVSFEKNVLVIGFDPEFADHLGLVDNARNHTLLQTKLVELGHAGCQIKFVKAEAPAVEKIQPPVKVAPAAETTLPAAVKAPAATTTSAKQKAPAAFNKNDFKNDPLIQKALEIFKGQIIEVRA
ncbi:MAG TPA: DNA polymerase III subunit gamma/tau, partial [Verrucomicrobiae bacterium]|nr:DNA polymerase III subunit gamma/tau [Verrucomicrobiae bacterium]